MSRYVLALDQGTTSSRAILFDHNGRACAMSQKEIAQLYPCPGWVEHDPEEIWETQIAAARQAMQIVDARPEDIAAVGITNQRETTVIWDRDTGAPIYNAIVWQDRRTSDRCTALKSDGHEEWIRAKTGLLPDSYFSATKIEWLLKNIPGARKNAEEGRLAFGTIDSFLIWRLTGGVVHTTDVSNASRTMLFDIHKMEWSPELLRLFNVPQSLLPTVVDSSAVVGETVSELLGNSIPIAGIAGDQQAATFGQACFHSGMAKSTYGTGCFILMNTGPTPTPSGNRLLTTVAASTVQKPSYALEGSVFVAGAAIQWLRDEMGLIRHASEVEAIATTVPDSGGVYVVPAFTGLGAPHWDPYARGAIFGLTRGSGRAQIVRAALESIAFQCRDVLEAMALDMGSPITEIRVDGGAAVNDFLMQFQADICDIPVVRPDCTETTALGAAFLAGLSVGFWKSMEEIERLWTKEKVFTPIMPTGKREELIAGWHDSVRRVRSG